MNRRQALSFIAAITISTVLWSCSQKYEHRYRLTLEMETPDGVKSASSVIVSTLSDNHTVIALGSRFSRKLLGEAVFLDLGGGKNAIMLLTHGTRGGSGDGMYSLALRAVGADWGKAESHNDSINLMMRFWAGQKLPSKGPVELKGGLVPTIVTFTDIANPASAKVIFATDYREQCREDRKPACVPESIPIPVDEIATTFGPGYAFKRATVEIVPNDTPVTRGIDARLPQIMSKLDNLNKGSMSDSINAPFWVRAGHLTVR